MTNEAERRGIAIHTDTAWRARRGSTVVTSRGDIDAGYLVNAAGLFADRVAQAYGFGEGLRILPFRGAYLYASEEAPTIGVHLYPVPDLGMPFLGVHFTITAAGAVKIGPTALPLPWREAYDVASLRRFSAKELAESVTAQAAMLLSDASFRRHAVAEAPKLLRGQLVRHATELASGFEPAHFTRWGRPGIRAQLYDTRRHRLEMDFRFEGDDRSMHVLNAVSPAFTCSLAFAELVADAIAAAC